MKYTNFTLTDHDVLWQSTSAGKELSSMITETGSFVVQVIEFVLEPDKTILAEGHLSLTHEDVLQPNNKLYKLTLESQ